MGKNWVIIGFTTVLIISSLALIIGNQPFDSSKQSMAESWMFKGAYATYEGKIEDLATPYDINETIQVANLNTTQLQIQTNSSIFTSFAPTLTDQTTLWVSKMDINFQPEGETLAGTYNTEINVKNVGTRDA